MAHNYDCLRGRIREAAGGKEEEDCQWRLRILHKGSVLCTEYKAVYPKEGGLRGLILLVHMICQGTTAGFLI